MAGRGFSSLPLVAARNRWERKSIRFKHFAGKVRMDRARQDKGS
jgi:hypothetical protein